MKSGKKRGGRRLFVRIAAFVVLIVMLGTVALLDATRVLVSVMTYDADEIAAFLRDDSRDEAFLRNNISVSAVNALFESTEYVEQGALSRSLTLLLSVLTPRDSLRYASERLSYHISRGEYAKALMYANEAVSFIEEASTPQQADLWMKKGCLEYLLDDEAAAMLSLDKALLLDGTLTDAWYVRMQLNVVNGRLAQATQDVLRYLAAAPDNLEMRRVLGDLYAAQERYDLALTAYNELLRRSDDEQAHFMRGICLLQLSAYDEAIRDFSLCIARGAQEAASRYYRGVIHLQRNDFEGALNDFDRAIALRDRETASMELHYNRGVSRMALGDMAGAADDFALSAAEGKMPGESAYARGVCCMELGQYTLAAQQFEMSRAQGVNPGISTFYRAQCLMATGAFAAAADEFTACLEAQVEVPLSLYYRASCYVSMGEDDLAISDLLAAVAS